MEPILTEKPWEVRRDALAIRQEAPGCVSGPFNNSKPDAPGVFLEGRYGASTHSSEKGSEYEGEFEDEYDSGTIARS
jgi:hypothetical protein